MFPEIKKVLDAYDGHVFIIAIEINEITSNQSLESLKTILIIDLLKDHLSPEKIQNILQEEFYFEFVTEILLKNLQFYKNNNFFILALKITNFLNNVENT